MIRFVWLCTLTMVIAACATSVPPEVRIYAERDAIIVKVLAASTEPWRRQGDCSAKSEWLEIRIC